MTAQEEKVTTLAELPEPIARFIDETRDRPNADSYLVAVLQMIQKHFGYLPAGALNTVSQKMQIPAAKVTGVATFYHFFTFVPKGKHTVSVCMGTACYVKGAGILVDRLKDLLGIRQIGHASKDGQFTLEVARCVGACALAPVLIVDDKVYANVRPDELPKILSKYGFKPKAE
ncbi:MAG TPA: NAD(P)H-dependent oxidoreductase subunit E [Kiritimatiellia bacterium]|nr:NAD(P)H-dependent oxidoreductase subunit E [Kiritimatiellia bacterium]HRZ11076.1 NAD(P)H-dependent oxidoreductase subunit E [Kiritimatiellia bacterium]HSA18649.1 NAD(P)H-dependent oxidoreductase subunit E [Kiritimatiellia bacterium]